MPKVLGLVSFRIFPTHMGGQKGVALFYKHLQDFVPVVLATSMDNQQSAVIQTRNLLSPNRRIYKNLFTTKKLKQLVKDERIDVIIAEHSYAGWMAWMLHRATGKPFIIHSHNIESKRFRLMHQWWWRLYDNYERWIHRRAHHNFFISREDMEFAIRHFRLRAERCSVATYGIEEKKSIQQKNAVKDLIGLHAEEKILLFNGTLDYKPNYDAVVTLSDVIEPMIRKSGKQIRIIITGNRAPAGLVRKMLANDRITYVGYAEDVDLYYQAADLFLNPVANDSGVKTKVIEAIANNCSVVSTTSGISGIAMETCSNKIHTVADDNWEKFAETVLMQLSVPQPDTPASFYDYYSWKNITRNVSKIIEQVTNE